MNEHIEGGKYKAIIQTMVSQDNGSFCPFRKEKQMDYLFSWLSKDLVAKQQRVLDACCGYGRLIHFLNEFDSEQRYIGIDFVPELIDLAVERFHTHGNINFQCADVLSLSENFQKEFDIAINYKTLSWLPYYTTLIDQLVRVTKNKIYLTSLFYDGDIDFITKIYVNAMSGDENGYTYLNTYSLPKFVTYCKSIGVKKVNALDMPLDIDLEKPEHPDELRTYTMMMRDNKRIEITGNTILNWKLIELVL